jgi:primosomal protein N' (replication factor Y)
VSKFIFQIAVFVPLYNHFDYLAPKNISLEKLQSLKPGIRVKIPWGQREITGILLNISDKSTIPLKKLKPIIDIIDEVPLLPESILALIKFSSRYYHHPIGEVFEAAMPAFLRQGRTADYRQGYTEEFEDLPEVPFVLNSYQSDCVKKVLNKLGSFETFLLFGVTGSGKTEVYLHIIENLILQQKQALILVPEIGLTPQTVSRFEKRFLVKISVLHSGLSDRERHDSWMQAKNGDVAIIIGTRSAIFTPLKNPGIIIIDEEHDLSFKQQEGFKYSARDLAVLRGKLENIPVVLGSATPSLESFYQAKSHRYQLLTLPERAGSATHPIVKIMDMKKHSKREKSSISVELQKLIQQHLEALGQVLIFLNRRGFAPLLICRHCGWMAVCKRCDAKMTLHQHPAYLQCHHCLSVQSVDKICPECQDHTLSMMGIGTQRLEEELSQCFQHTPIIRIDKDTTRKKGSLTSKLDTIQAGHPCILVGTQMLAKGHHFPKVSLSVIMNVDGGLFSSDFRGLERTAQIIIQVGGRAGRTDKQGEVILQTYHPEHVLLNVLLEKGYDEFVKDSLKDREEAGFPPYQFFALIRAESVDIDFAMNFLTELKILIPSQNIQLLGPIPAPMQKKLGKHRAQLLLKSAQRNHLMAYLDILIDKQAELKYKSKVRWSIDVDPQEMF